MKSVHHSHFVVITFLSTFLFVHAFLSSVGARTAAAQDLYGNITVFADATGSSCSVTDQTPGLITLYVIHTNFWRMLTSDFRLAQSSGFTATYVAETHEKFHIGDFRNGISIAYGPGSQGPLLLGTISYQGQGTSEPCSYIDVVAWRYPWPATEDTDFEDHPAPPLGKLYVNPQPGGCPLWCTVPTMQSTWGNVKALYRD